MDSVVIFGFLTTVVVARAGCPNLKPPVNGVLKCQMLGSDLSCVATCYEGFEFVTGEKVANRTCHFGAESWLEGPAQLSQCTRSCTSNLIDGGPGKTIIASSSQAPADVFGPQAARLSAPEAWRPTWDDILQYIQVDMGSPHVIRGWRIRGDGHGSYVRLFRLLFSLDGMTWTPYSEGQVMDKFFIGSFDDITEVTQMLTQSEVARYVRLNPLIWHGHIALKWDLVGCSDSSEPGAPNPGDENGDSNCQTPLPPANAAVNCERNASGIVCTAYCLNGRVFSNHSPVIDMNCDPALGITTSTTLPSCVEPDTNVVPVLNISGPCLQTEHDCYHAVNGDFQYCGDCHYFSTCSEGYFFVRPCPASLQFDSLHHLCNYKSTTCHTGAGKAATP